MVSSAVRSKQAAQKVPKKDRNQAVSDLSMAGAEGIEPSARGFGVDVEKALHRSAFRSFQPLADFRRFVSLPFDAFLMLLPIGFQRIKSLQIEKSPKYCDIILK